MGSASALPVAAIGAHIEPLTSQELLLRHELHNEGRDVVKGTEDNGHFCIAMAYSMLLGDLRLYCRW